MPLENYTSIIYNKILQDVLDGKLQPGERLNDMEISREHGFSRTPAREALLLLEQDGFVVTVNKKGTFVNHFSKEDARQIYLVREALETHAVRLGTPGVGDDVLMVLEDIVSRMDRTMEEKRYSDYPKLDLEFHRVLINTCNVPLLIKMCEKMNLLATSVFSKGDQYTDNIEAYHTSHRKIFKALSERDAIEVERLVGEHINRGKIDLMIGMG